MLSEQCWCLRVCANSRVYACERTRYMCTVEHVLKMLMSRLIAVGDLEIFFFEANITQFLTVNILKRDIYIQEDVCFHYFESDERVVSAAATHFVQKLLYCVPESEHHD